MIVLKLEQLMNKNEDIASQWQFPVCSILAPPLPTGRSAPAGNPRLQRREDAGPWHPGAGAARPPAAPPAADRLQQRLGVRRPGSTRARGGTGRRRDRGSQSQARKERGDGVGVLARHPAAAGLQKRGPGTTAAERLPHRRLHLRTADPSSLSFPLLALLLPRESRAEWAPEGFWTRRPMIDGCRAWSLEWWARMNVGPYRSVTQSCGWFKTRHA
ncbi:hypothetical protein BS78_08G109200 [Paspalum vaginatum]|nr:hypothetical protein BS78_08G109200 [Paspalum vaginatum]